MLVTMHALRVVVGLSYGIVGSSLWILLFYTDHKQETLGYSDDVDPFPDSVTASPGPSPSPSSSPSGSRTCIVEDLGYGYLDGSEMYRNGLVSFPRSGNTWTRITFQRVTGIYSGSIYNGRSAPSPLLHVPGTENVYVVKSHSTGITYPRMAPGGRAYAQDFFTFERAVHLVRDPFDSVWSLLNKIETGTFTGTAQISPKMVEKTTDLLDTWSEHWEYWSHVEIPVLRVRYEDLQEAPTRPLLR